MVMASGRDAGRAADRLTVIGVFDDASLAEGTLGGLRDAGFTAEQISVVAKDSHTARAMTEEAGIGSPAEGAGTGAFLGGLTGGVLGWLVGIGALAIPGIGPIVAAGALATTLGGAALGAVTGGLIGALVDLGIPEEEARGYEESVRGGSILLTVHAANTQQAHDARALLHQYGGADVRAYGIEGGDTAGSGTPILGQAGAAAGGTVLDAATDPRVGRPQVEPLEGGATRRSAVPETEWTGAPTVITSGEMRDAPRREGGAEG